MRHLISGHVYQKPEDIRSCFVSRFDEIGCDGMELLTGYEPIDPAYKDFTVSVHLPYSVDSISVLEGASYDLDDDFALFYTAGRSRKEILDNIYKSIDYASALDPIHGVFHVTNVRLTELRARKWSGDSEHIIKTQIGLMNEAVSRFPDKEPPFKIVFENLWWPGLRMLDPSDYYIIKDTIGFDNWGLCIDTGHLMNCIPGIETQQDGIDALLDIFSRYPDELIDRVSAVHFHYSASGRYRAEFEETPYNGGPLKDYISGSYPHICTMDQHLPFSDPRCKELLEALEPDTVIHELPGHGHDPVIDFIQQRSLLD